MTFRVARKNCFHKSISSAKLPNFCAATYFRSKSDDSTLFYRETLEQVKLDISDRSPEYDSGDEVTEGE